MADQTATYSVKVQTGDAKAAATEAADALEKLRSSIVSSQSSIKGMQDSLRSLRGTNDEVRAAKSKLQAQIEAERSSVSASNLAIIKQGQSFDGLQKNVKMMDAIAKAYTASVEKYQEQLRSNAMTKAAEDAKKLETSMASAGGPIQTLRGRLTELRQALSTTDGQLALLAVGMVAIIAVTARLVSALGEAAFALVRFAVEGANAARTANLQREAWTGSAESAIALGHQIDALARKVPTAKDELQKLSGEIVKSLNNARISGQGMVDTFNAVAQASAAMGDEVGARLRSIVERSKNIGRVVINPFELQGTGLGIQDIGRQLAQLTGVSLAAANRALAVGGVEANLFAQALRRAAEVRFSDINARRMLDLNVLAQKFRENLAALTRDVKIEPLLEAFRELGDLFSTTTVSGAVLKTMIEAVGDLFPTIKEGTPIVKELFERLELGAIRVEIAFYKAKNAIDQAFANQGSLVTTSDIIEAIDHHVDGLTKGLVYLVAVATAWSIALGQGAHFVSDTFASLKGELSKGWQQVGLDMATGLAAGLASGVSSVVSAVMGMGESAKDAFKGALGIHSPSSVFEDYGEQTTAGYERGVTKSSGRAQDAVEGMAPGAPRGGAGGGRAPVKVEVNIHGASGPDAAKKMTEASFLDALTKAIEDALVAAGVGPQAEPV